MAISTPFDSLIAQWERRKPLRERYPNDAAYDEALNAWEGQVETALDRAGYDAWLGEMLEPEDDE